MFVSEDFFAVVATPVPVQLLFSGNILNPKEFFNLPANKSPSYPRNIPKASEEFHTFTRGGGGGGAGTYTLTQT